MPSKTLISGEAGVAVLLDGERVRSFHVDDSYWAERQLSDIARLFEGCADVITVEGLKEQEVPERLKLEWRRNHCLLLCLLLLKAKSDPEARRLAVKDTEHFLGDDAVYSFIEARLFAAAMPSSADLPGAVMLAHKAGTIRLLALLQEVQAMQGEIAQCRASWDAVPAEFLGGALQKEMLAFALVHGGAFKKVVSTPADQRINMLPDLHGEACLQQLSGSARALQSWLRPLSTAANSNDLSTHPSKPDLICRGALTGGSEKRQGVESTVARRSSLGFDYLIVGAGFSGSVVASEMARTLRKKVLLVDRRPHVAGNAYDHYDKEGVMVHKYGPHIFHTNSKDVFGYLSRFTEWRDYEHRVLASVDGKLVPIPINLDTINLLYGLKLEADELEGFLDSIAEKRTNIVTSEDVIVNRVGRNLYERMFRNYTRKQWGLDPSELDAAVTARISVRLDRDDRYFSDTYQAMPRHGFTRLFENMLDHPNIVISLNTDYREIINTVRFREMIYTGPVDEFFDYRFGKLPYRSLQFRHETLNMERLQPVAVINYPNEHDYIRVTEFKYLTGQTHAKTSVVYEYPTNSGDPYYPVPRPENAALYKRYEALAKATPGVHFTGGLATYKYYNMDQAVAQALTLCAKLTGASQALAGVDFPDATLDKGRAEVLRHPREGLPKLN